MSLIAEIEATHDEFTALRRDIHAHPELAFQENRTSDVVAERLASWGIEVHRGLGQTGVVGVLKGSQTKAGSKPRSIGLRADMDALPMPEHNRFAHASRNPGRMHGCGHDGHTAMLLGAAKYLAAHRDFDGIVNFIFQPAEEGGNAGAKAMMADGLFDKFPCDEIYGIHNMPGFDVGHFGFRKGPTMASSNRFDIFVRGTGGHAAQPHKSVDTIVIAAEMVGVLQTLISRHKNPIDIAVLSITQIHAGDAYNVLPGETVIRGTCDKVRLLDLVEDFTLFSEHKAGLIKALAQNFAEKKFVRTPQKFDPALAKKGKDVHDKNCEKCHSEGGSLASDDASILAGQKMAYLKEQTEFFLGGKRTMPKKMKPKLEGLDKAEVEAVIHYYGSFK